MEGLLSTGPTPSSFSVSVEKSKIDLGKKLVLAYKTDFHLKKIEFESSLSYSKFNVIWS